MQQPFSIQSYGFEKNIFDVRTLLLLNIAISLMMLYVSIMTVVVSAFLISFIIMLFFKMKKIAFNYLIAFVVCFILYHLHLNFSIKFFALIFSFLRYIAFMIIKMLSFIMVAHIIIRKVTSTELVYALRKMKLHKGFVLSLTIAIRFLPTAKKEFNIIKECMKMRGIETSWKSFFKNPLLLIEYSLVPMLFRTVKISEEMTTAALVKGVEYNGEKTSLIDVRFSKNDFFIALFAIVLLSLSFIYSDEILGICTELKTTLYSFVQKVAV